MKHKSLITQSFHLFLFPTIISYAMGSINGVVDAIIVGNIVGEGGLSVVNMCLPINVLIITVMTVCFVGASIIASRSIASGNHTTTASVFTTATIATLGLSIMVSALGVCNIDSIAAFLCHNEQLRADVCSYAQAMFISLPVMAMCGGLATIIKTDSSPRLVTNAVIIATSINMILDFVFIKYCHTGVVGSAWAAAIGFAVSLCVCSLHFTFKRSHLHLCNPLPKTYLREMIILGLPITIQQFCNAIRAAAINNMVEDNLGLHGEAILMLFINFAILGGVLFSGINQVMQIINSSAIGCSDHRGFKIAQRHAITYTAIGVSIIVVGIFTFPKQVSAMFGYTADATTNIRQLAPALILMAANYTLMSIYQIIGKAKMAIAISLSQTLMALPTMMVLLHFSPENFCLTFSIAELITLLWIIAAHHPLKPDWGIVNETVYRITSTGPNDNIPDKIIIESTQVEGWTVFEATIRTHSDGHVSTLFRHNGKPSTDYTYAIGMQQRLM